MTKGRKHYGKGGGYSFFAGIDGTRGFVTGEFNAKGLVDNIEGLEDTHYIGLQSWIDLYEKEYTYIGKLEGYFYDIDGNPKDGVRVFEEGVKRGQIAKKQEGDEKLKFPGCNSLYTPETGAEVWCSTKRCFKLHNLIVSFLALY